MYELVDSGNGKKLERFGDYRLVRPCAQAVWRPASDKWESDAAFSREDGWKGKLPDEWTIELEGIRFLIRPTDFGHVGIFPEHRTIWQSMGLKPGSTLLNLFAYSGAVSLAAAKAGAKVCHVDASQGMVDWARENARMNSIDSIRWIVDDVMKFCAREIRRGRKYDAIVLDPPTYGRGAKGEMFKIEEKLVPLLDLCRQLLSDDPLFVALSCHTPGYSPIVLQNLLGGDECGEMIIRGPKPLPSGAYARWRP